MNVWFLTKSLLVKKKKILMILSVGERWKYLYQNVNLA